MLGVKWVDKAVNVSRGFVHLPLGDPKSRNDGTAEWRNHGTAENNPKS